MNPRPEPAPPRAAVALFVYRRPDLTRRVFETVRAARPPRLYVFADGPRPGEEGRCAAAREATEGVDWPCEVVRDYADENLGCRRRVVSGLDAVFAREEAAIILEDDCLPDPTFFSFCEELLARYAQEPRVAAVNGSAYAEGAAAGCDYRFSRYPHYGGWATWRRAWRLFDGGLRDWPTLGEAWLAERFADPEVVAFWRERFEITHQGWLDSWGYGWTFACWRTEGLCATPRRNLIRNLGFRGDATHTAHESPFADLPTGAIPPPLRHPHRVVRDEERDRATQALMLSELPRRPEAAAARPGAAVLPTTAAGTRAPLGSHGPMRWAFLSARGARGCEALARALEARGDRVVRVVHGACADAAATRLPLDARPELGLRRILREVRPHGVLAFDLHGPAGWSPELLRVCRRAAPTAWWLEDAYSFTGRCLDPAGCRAFLRGCDADCPTPAEYPPLPRSRIARAWAERQRLLADLPDLIALCASELLAREARAGLWRGHRVVALPRPVTLAALRGGGRETARRALGCAASALALLVPATSLEERRQGAVLLGEVLARVPPPWELWLLGRAPLPPLPAGVRVRAFAEADPLGRALAFAASDVLLQPARREAFGDELVEALACGTAVVTTPSGGAEELARAVPGSPVFVAERANARDLADALESFLSVRASGRLSANAARATAARHDATFVAERVRALFREAFPAAGSRSKRGGLWRALRTPRGPRAEALRAAFAEVLARSPRRAELRHYHEDPRSVDAIAADLATGPEARRQAARRRARAGWRSLAAGEVRPLGDVVRAAFACEARDWEGTLFVYAPGKAGEVFYLCGLAAALRRRIPRARLVLRTLPTYAAVAEGAAPSFDSVEPLRAPSLVRLADRVAAANACYAWPGFAVVGAALHVAAFRSHGWFREDPLVSAGPFPYAFADALGCPRDDVRLPGWKRGAGAGAQRLALAFPTANHHSSRRGGLAFAAAEWALLGEAARAHGLLPIAHGLPDPGRPELPGWVWSEATLPELFALFPRADWVVGPNSGAVWAACALSPGQVFLLDDSEQSEGAHGRYRLADCGEFLDLARCAQIRLDPSGADDARAFARLLASFESVPLQPKREA